MRLLKKHLDIAGLLFISLILILSIHYYLDYKLVVDMEEVLDYTKTVRQNIKNAIDSSDPPRAGIEIFARITESFKMANKYKLAHCEIPKVMSTVMMNVFCYLYSNNIFFSRGKQIQTGWWTRRSCENRNEYYGYSDMEKHLPDGYNVTVLVREPFTRFMSAFMNKCIREPNDYLAGSCRSCRKGTCFDCDLKSSDYMDCVLTRLTENLKQVDQTLNYSRSYQYELAHMAPYTWFCNLKTSYKDSIFIRYHSSGSNKIKMINQLVSVFANQNVPDDQLRYIRKSLNTGETTWHATGDSDEKAFYIQQIKTNATLFSKLLNIYMSDYTIFDFPLPSVSSSHLFSS